MNYCIDPSVDEPIMLLNKHIGYDEQEGMGIDGSIFQTELLQLDTLGKKRIQVWINSPGGVVTDGYSIYSAILKSDTPVDTYAIGAAASIAGVIFQAGRKRIMADYAWLMYHNPFGGGDDALLKTMKDSIIKMIEQRSGMNEKDVTKMMARTTFIDADEAMEMKLCDSIDSSVDMNTKYLRKITDSLQFYRECNKVLNSFLNNNTNTMSLTKVTMRLKLNDAAREDDIISAIDAIENRAKKAEAEIDDAENKVKKAEARAEEAENKAKDKAKADSEEMDKLKAKLDKAKADLEKAQKDFDDSKAKLDAMEADKKAAQDKAEEEKAKNMIEGFAKAGRIKNEETVKLKWMTTAKTLGFDEVKSMIEALPLNKDAVLITDAVPNKIGKDELPTTAIGLAVKNKLRREGKI
ncbi:MAG TPA: ATP-dependent Clp protease proteolytic subunit [Hanamia sp.]|nr:ATP-dependent Clp protease proteolytic subunit [Hanamia sp.]